MRTILGLAGVAMALLSADAARAAPQPPASSAIPQPANTAPPPAQTVNPACSPVGVSSGAPASADTVPAARHCATSADDTPPQLGPVGACLPGYAQDPKAVAEAVESHTDPVEIERAVALVPCVRVGVASTAGVRPASPRTAPKPH